MALFAGGTTLHFSSLSWPRPRIATMKQRAFVVQATSSLSPWASMMIMEASHQVRGRRPKASATSDPASKSSEYNKVMKNQMRNPYEYHHDLGMNYTVIVDNLIVGSQPQTVEDIDYLHEEEDVSVILNLQQDKDVEYWGVDLPAIVERSNTLGITHIRVPARDFDPNSLRNELPRAVAVIEDTISRGETIYVHCTAGLGRAPAVAIAYLFWFRDMDMNTAYEFLTSKRPCGPKKEAIRGATYDMAKDNPNKAPLEQLPDDAFADISAQERRIIQDRVRSLR